MGTLARNVRRNGRRQDGKAPLPTERQELRQRLIQRQIEWGRTKRLKGGGPAKWLALLNVLLARLDTFRPVRALKLYILRHGPLLSAGIGFTMFFSITGLLATGFSVAGLVLRGQPLLLDSMVESVDAMAPGLLKTGGEEGLVDPYELLNPTGLGWAAVIAAAVTVFSSLGWIGGLREGLREVAGLDRLEQNPILGKLVDAGILLLLGVALVVSGGASLVFGTAAGWVIDVLRLDEAVAGPLTWLVRTGVPLLLNCATAAILFRLAGRLQLGKRAFIEGILLAGAGTTVLQIFSTELLARAGRNPILASFAIIIGLLIWFNLVSQVYLASASWAAVREADEQASGESSKGENKTLGSRHRRPRALPAKGTVTEGSGSGGNGPRDSPTGTSSAG